MDDYLDKSGGPDACWLFNGRPDDDGYGRFSFQGRDVAVHRVALEQRLGRALAPGEVARHICHSRLCGNGSHLIPGTIADNNRDTVEAGRQARGETAGAAKLTAAQVAEILLLVPSMGYGRYELLGRRYGVSGREISYIAKGRRWKHLPSPVAP